MAVSERDAFSHGAMKEGGGSEVTALGRKGGECGHIQGIQLVWAPPGYGDLLQIPGEGDIGGGRVLAKCGQKPGEGAGSVAEDNKNHQQGGGGSVFVPPFL